MTKLITKPVILVFLILLPKITISQLTGVGAGFGTTSRNSFHEDSKKINAQLFHFEYNRYLSRFWSASANYQFQSGNFGDEIHVNNRFYNNAAGISLSYWYLSDLRLLGTMARRSCKGQMVALSYKFNSFLFGGIFLNQLRSKENNLKLNYSNYSVGIGFNLWQFKTSERLRYKAHIKYLINPFLKISYDGLLSPLLITEDHYLPSGAVNIHLGVRLGNLRK